MCPMGKHSLICFNSNNNNNNRVIHVYNLYTCKCIHVCCFN